MLICGAFKFAVYQTEKKLIKLSASLYLCSPFLCSVFFMVTLTLVSSFVHAQIPQVDFNIQSQPLNDALVQFSAQTGIQFIYTEDGVLETETDGLNGFQSINEGLNLLLDGTGYTYEFSNPDTVRIFKAIDSDILSSDWGAEFADDGLSSMNDEEINAETSQTGSESNSISHRDRTLQEVIVTARMREEDIQDVPISIMTFSTEDMESRSIDNVFDMNVLLPNVNIRSEGTSASTGQFVIRGVPGVARYVDGVPQHANEGALFNILELERIEVLRGPQGTLFGKNALSGAIQYITRKPGEEFSTRLKMTMGSFNRRDIVANIDIPLSETLFSKLTAASLNRDGFVDTAVPDFKHGNRQNSVLRGMLYWLPTEEFGAMLIMESNKVEQHQQANVLYDVIETQNQVMAYNDAGFVFTDATHAFGQREQYRTGSAYTGPGDLFGSQGITLDLNWSISESLTFRSITGRRAFDFGNFQDLDASEYTFFEQWFYQQDKELSQEFKLQGEREHYNWTAGLYLDSYHTNERAIRWQYEEIMSRPRNEVIYTKRRDRALFAEGSYDITENMVLTLGLRTSIEDFENANYTAAESRPPVATITKNITPGNLVKANVEEFKSTTPRFSITYDWSDNIMTYLTYSEGFNGGGVNGTPIAGQFFTYSSELLSQYEIGLRSDLFNNRLRFNAAYFAGVWDDIQVAEVIIPAILTTRNAGKADVAGIEVDIFWAINDNMNLNFSAAWLDTGYTDVGTATSITTDSTFALAPETSFSLGLSYDWPLDNYGGMLSLRTDYGWLDDHYTIDDIRLQKLQEAYGLLSGRLTYTSESESWQLGIFGTNLTNEWFQLGGFSATLGGVDQGIVARPREIGVSLGLTF
tara:strand:+ start:343 stop:2940 length:2598 start_codon:yes stop_codon:yes gene_type:complete